MPDTSVVSRATAGAVAAIAGVGVEQLLSNLSSPAAVVMNLAPKPIRDWAVQTFGTSAGLFLSLLALELIVAIVAVAAIWEDSRIPVVSIFGVGVVCCAAVLALPGARLIDIMPTLAGVATAVAVLRLLTFDRPADKTEEGPADPIRRRSFATLGFAVAGLAGGVAVANPSRPNSPSSDGKPVVGLPPARQVTSIEITDSTPIGRALIAAENQRIARNEIGAARRLDGTVFVEDFRDGQRTDHEIITAAFGVLAAGGELRFGQGVTYSVREHLDFFMVDKPNVLINGQGATIDGSSGWGSGGALLRVQGSKYSTTTALKSSIPVRANKLRVASSAGYQGGEMIAIRSDSEVFNWDGGDPPDNFKQELARVLSVPNGDIIILEEQTWNTYSLAGHSVDVQQYAALKNLAVRDLNFVGMRNNSTDQTGLWVRYFDGLHIENVKVIGSSAGILIQEGLNATVRNCRAEYVNRFPNGSGAGFYARECQVVKFIDCFSKNCRHAIDIDMVRDSLYLGCSAEGSGAAAFSTHGNCDVSKIVDCTARECGGGMIVRGRNSLVRGNHILGSKIPGQQAVPQSYLHGIMVGAGYPAAFGKGNGGIDLVIDGNYIDIAGPDYAARPDLRSSGISVTAALVNSRITDNYIRGFSGHGIHAFGDYNVNLDIRGNQIDCSSQLARQASSGIRVEPANTGGGSQTNVTIEQNTVKPGAIHSGIYVAGGPDAPRRMDQLRIRWNAIGACGSFPIVLGQGHFGLSISIYGNETADTDPVELTAAMFEQPPTIGLHDYGRGLQPLGVGQEAGARMRPGLLYSAPSGSVAPGAVALDRLSAVPIFVPRRVTVDSIGVTVVEESGVIGSSAMLAIYRDAADGYGGYPGVLVHDSVGIVPTDSAGYGESEIPSVVLNPGLYWLAFVAHVAPPEVLVVSGGNLVIGSSSTSIVNGCGYVQGGISDEPPPIFTNDVRMQDGLPLVHIRIS